jgi:hypothetical protein
MNESIHNRGFGLGRSTNEWSKKKCEPRTEREHRHRTRKQKNVDIKTAIEDGIKKAVQEGLQDALRELGNMVDSAFKQAQFKALASEWKAKTILYSRVSDTVFDLAYQRIIGMGPDVVPFILEDLRDNGPNHWFWALRVITNENPATKEMAGNMVAMTEAWLQWGKNKGYLKNYQKNIGAHSQT